MSERKPTNPKDAVGILKPPMSTIPSGVLIELGLALMEGARKYGRHNYRIAGIRASVYYDATMRHLLSWWEGEDIDPDSGLSHVTKAIASLTVLRDAMICSKREEKGHLFVDDRPPMTMPFWWMAEAKAHAERIVDAYPDSVDAFVKGDDLDEA